MTQDDDNSIPEDEMDELVARVVEQLRETPAEEHDIEVHVEDDAGDPGPDRTSHDDAEAAGDSGEDPHERAERRRESARETKREARKRAREARSSGVEDLGERIEAAVEAQLEGVAESIERSFGGATPDPPEPPAHGVTIGPGDTGEKAVYKTQLQKGGRVAVPDAEMDALGLEPGDTLQVVLYPV